MNQIGQYATMAGFVGTGLGMIWGALRLGKPRPLQVQPKQTRAVEVSSRRGGLPEIAEALEAHYGPAERRRREVRLGAGNGVLQLPQAPKAVAVAPAAPPALAAKPFEPALHNGWGRGTRDASAWDTAGGIKQFLEISQAEENALRTRTQEWDISRLWETDAPVDDDQDRKARTDRQKAELLEAEQWAGFEQKWAATECEWEMEWDALDEKLDKLSWGGYRDALNEARIDVWAAEALHVNTSELYAIMAPEPANR